MSPFEISIKSILTEERASLLMGKLAIKDSDELSIEKLIELANKGYTDIMIINDFHENKYYL